MQYFSFVWDITNIRLKPETNQYIMRQDDERQYI